MASYSENDQIPLSVARRNARSAAQADGDDEGSHLIDNFAIPEDRMTPSIAGGIAGFLGGLAALAVVYGLDPVAFSQPIVSAAQSRGVDTDIAFVVAYVTAGSIGALVGATFAVVTRYLRKWVPLLVWALVFFISLAMLLLAASSAYGRGAGTSLAGPILAASAAFGFIVSFSLPIRRRR